MPNNLNTTVDVNHAFDFEFCDEKTLCGGGDNVYDTVELLRAACIAARRVLCEAVLRDDFQHDGASDAISSLNKALVCSSF